MLKIQLIRHYPPQITLTLNLKRIIPRKQLINKRPKRPNINLLIVLVAD